MAILVKLDDLLHERRMTLTEVAERIGITLPNLSILKTGKARAIRFSTLEAICEVLVCQPGDLLEAWVSLDPANPPDQVIRRAAGTRALSRKPIRNRLPWLVASTLRPSIRRISAS